MVAKATEVFNEHEGKVILSFNRRVIYKEVQILTTAAISAPVLWFKAASTTEAMKKKKVLSPVLTRS